VVLQRKADLLAHLAEAAARKEAGNAAFAGGDVRTALDEWARGDEALKAEAEALKEQRRARRWDRR
jgi:hypothetical protein